MSTDTVDSSDLRYIRNWQKKADYGAATKEQVQELIDRVKAAWCYDYGRCEVLTPYEMRQKCEYFGYYGEEPYYEFYTGGWSENEEIIWALLKNKKARLLIEMYDLGAMFIIRSKL